ncbi:uncharacterized protein PGRI_079710 [Penicillium griseofulvum]|uniref:Uncharacterized protein n=1 Tax=Penicillium patulum TaxID=5078 RepID=A0A135LUT2_PENPA|nr:uncharacterized protein PGRI_079710 [Penicillium griseofulvum]KXG52715.1 hypothetical protein PGRI_079710 [Penicillium griseofulvum]
MYTDSEGPRGRTGRPETPSSSAASSSRRSTLNRVHFEEPEMCIPLASPRSDDTVTALRVPVASSSTNPKVGLPSTVAGSSETELPPSSVDKHNSFARQGKSAGASHLSSSSHPSHPSSHTLRSSSIPPVPPFPVSILKNRNAIKPRSLSAPPSPPKMADGSGAPEGNNKPLPPSPTKSAPHTPSPHTPSKEGMRHPVLGTPLMSPTGVSPTLSQHSSLTLTLKDLPEAVRALQFQHDATQKRLAKKIGDINRLEQKVDDFLGFTENYIGDQTNAQLKRSSELAFDFAQVQRDAREAKGQVDQIKEAIHEMRLEINGLTSSLCDLSAKVDMCLTGIWDNTEEPFVAFQRRRNDEIDADVNEIGDNTVKLKAESMFLRRAIICTMTAVRVMQYENNLYASRDVEVVLPPFPLGERDDNEPGLDGNPEPWEEAQVGPAIFRPAKATPSLPRPVPGLRTPSATTVPANATPSGSSTVTGKRTPSTTVPANATPSGSSTVTGKRTPSATTVSANATPSGSNTVTGKRTPSTTVPAKATPPAPTTVPAKTTPPASATGSTTITPPGSATVKQSSIPRRSKKKKKTLSKKSSSSQQNDKENTSNNTGNADNTESAELKANKDANDKECASEKKGKSLFGFRRRSDSVSSATSGRLAARRDDSIPPVPELPRGIVLPGPPGEPIPLANIHPLYRPQFQEVNAEGIPAAPVIPTASSAARATPRPEKAKGPESPSAGKDKTRK